MTGGMFQIQPDGQLAAMNEAQYDSESLLQDLLARFPQLLPGDQINPEVPRRWLLVAREMGVPAMEEGTDRWAVDHLFLDQEGIPTIVEVKRHTDTRLRREVVGQMLDYAANAVRYWSSERLRARFEASSAPDRDPKDVLGAFLGSDADVEQFWQQVKTNLQAGRLRLVFVANEIPPELRRIVEFMNTQMDPTEVLAVEIRQFLGFGLPTLVATVLGQTAEAQQRKGTAPGRGKEWDQTSFLQELDRRRGSQEAGVAREILRWAASQDLTVKWGNGRVHGTFQVYWADDEANHPLFGVWSWGAVQVPLGQMQGESPFAQEDQRRELVRRLNEIPGVAIPDSAVNKWPNIPLTKLVDDAALAEWLTVFDWAFRTMRGARDRPEKLT